MQVTEAGDLTTYEPLPIDQSMYLSVYRYKDSKTWFGGPANREKQPVIDMLQSYSAEEVRIYHVRLPMVK